MYDDPYCATYMQHQHLQLVEAKTNHTVSKFVPDIFIVVFYMYSFQGEYIFIVFQNRTTLQ